MLRQMPDGVRPSVVMDDFGDVYGMFYAITTDGVGDEQLLDYAQLVKRELQDIEGYVVLKSTEPDPMYQYRDDAG